MAVPLDADARDRIIQEVLRLDGVLHAALDERVGTTIWVVRDSDHAQGPIELAVRNRVAALGYDPAGLDVRVSIPTFAGPRRRVRFEGVEREERAGEVTVRVALEWGGTVYTGEASGERGPAIELKTTAQAAIEALENLSGQTLEMKIIGVKAIHAFDSDLMVASVHRSGDVRQRLVGTVVVHDDPLGAAAVAVLAATNRTFGNFLHAAD